MKKVMEKVIERKSIWPSLGTTLLLLAITATMVTIVFGADSMMAGVHDTFHDFRHSIGMPCH